MQKEDLRAQELTLISWEDRYILSSKIETIDDLLGIQPLFDILCFNLSEPLDVMLYALEYDTQADNAAAIREDMAIIAANLATLLNDNAVSILAQRTVTFPVLADLPVEVDKRKHAVMQGYSEIQIS